MFRPRRGGGSHRFVFWQVGLFFLAAGVWLGGVVTGRPGAAAIAIPMLVVAMILGALGRRRSED